MYIHMPFEQLRVNVCDVKRAFAAVDLDHYPIDVYKRIRAVEEERAACSGQPQCLDPITWARRIHRREWAVNDAESFETIEDLATYFEDFATVLYWSDDAVYYMDEEHAV